MAERSFEVVLKQSGTGKVAKVLVKQTQFVPVYTFTCADSTMSVAYGGGSKTFNITSHKTVVGGGTASVGYTASVTGGGASYVSVSGGVITVKANNTYVAQSATVTFTQKESSNKHVVTVTLAKKPDFIEFSVVPTSLSFAPEASSKELSVTSRFNEVPRGWDIDTSVALPGWLKVTASDKSGGVNKISVSVTNYGA